MTGSGYGYKHRKDPPTKITPGGAGSRVTTPGGDEGRRLKTGGDRAGTALDATSQLVTGVTAAAKYADGVTGIDGLKPAEAGANVTETRTAAAIAGQGALATKSAVDLATADVSNKNLGNIADTGARFAAVEAGADKTSTKTSADTAAVAGTAAATVQSGAARGQGGFTNATGGLVSTATESGTKPVNRLYAKVLAADPDNYDSVAEGTSFKRVGASQINASSQVMKLGSLDVRNDNQPPSFYQMGQTVEFKNRSVIGAPGSTTYGQLTTDKPWGDSSGGDATQTFRSADGAFKREGPSSGSTWGSWRYVIEATTQRIGRDTGHLTSDMQESGTKPVNRLLAKALAADPDNADSVVDSATKRVIPFTVLRASDGQLLTGVDAAATLAGRTAQRVIGGLKGGQLWANPDFADGTIGGIGIYDNASTGRISLSVVTDATAPNSSGKFMRVSWSASASDPTPGHGGFVPSLGVDAGLNRPGTYHKGGELYFRYIMKIPVGKKCLGASNPTGDGATDAFIGSVEGTGNWETYLRRRTIGVTGTFSTTGHVYFAESGADVNDTNAFQVDVAMVEIIDVNQPNLVYGGVNIREASSGNRMSDDQVFHGRSGATESGNKPLNKLYAKVLAADADTADSVVTGATKRVTTLNEATGAARAFPALDASNLLITGISSAAKYADGTTAIDARKPAEAGANVTETRTSADTTAVAGTAAATVKSGAVKANLGLAADGDLTGNIDGDTEVQVGHLYVDATKRVKVGTAGTPGTLTRKMRIPFGELLPYDDTVTYAGSGFGYLHPRTGGVSSSFTGSVLLPDGARIEAFRARHYRNDINDTSRSWLKKTDGTTVTTLSTLQMSTTGAWITLEDTAPSELVDNSGNVAYFIEVTVTTNAGSAASEARFAWAEIEYTIPDLGVGF